MISPSKKFRHVISIGCSCLTAHMLKRLNLRRYSGPFDWVFSNPNLVLSCIKDDFWEYLDRDNFVNDGSPTGWGHKTYILRYGQRRTFNRHNMQDPVDYEHLRRCAIRFQALRHLNDRVMLVLTLPADILANEAVQRDLLEIANAFRDARIVAIGLTSAGPPSVACRSESDKFDAYLVTPSAATTNGLWFEADSDNALLDQVMSRYEFDLDDDFFGVRAADETDHRS